jgi:hypothetical protein
MNAARFWHYLCARWVVLSASAFCAICCKKLTAGKKTEGTNDDKRYYRFTSWGSCDIRFFFLAAGRNELMAKDAMNTGE